MSRVKYTVTMAASTTIWCDVEGPPGLLKDEALQLAESEACEPSICHQCSDSIGDIIIDDIIEVREADTDTLHEYEMEDRSAPLKARIRALENFVRTCRDTFDCDQDAHQYGTQCWACDAAKLMPEEEA